MRLRKQRPAPPAPPQEPSRQDWHELLDPQERPNREDLAAQHHFAESLLEPVPMPKWLRGKKRPPRDKLS